jgi:hypothetical protein
MTYDIDPEHENRIIEEQKVRRKLMSEKFRPAARIAISVFIGIIVLIVIPMLRTQDSEESEASDQLEQKVVKKSFAPEPGWDNWDNNSGFDGVIEEGEVEEPTPTIDEKGFRRSLLPGQVEYWLQGKVHKVYPHKRACWIVDLHVWRVTHPARSNSEGWVLEKGFANSAFYHLKPENVADGESVQGYAISDGSWSYEGKNGNGTCRVFVAPIYEGQIRTYPLILLKSLKERRLQK